MYKICCTVENQRQAQLRLPVYQQLPIRHKSIICSPLLRAIDPESLFRKLGGGGDGGRRVG